MSVDNTTTRDDLASALAAADALDTFQSLPEEARHQFEAWIDKARDRVAHWRRIDTLVMAMRYAPRLDAATATGSVIEPEPLSETDR